MSDRREICHRKCHTNPRRGGAVIVSGVYGNNLASDLTPVSGTDASIAESQTSEKAAESCSSADSGLARNSATENATPAPRPEARTGEARPLAAEVRRAAEAMQAAASQRERERVRASRREFNVALDTLADRLAAVKRERDEARRALERIAWESSAPCEGCADEDDQCSHCLARAALAARPAETPEGR